MPLQQRTHSTGADGILETTGNASIGTGNWTHIVVNGGHTLSIAHGADVRVGTMHVHGVVAGAPANYSAGATGAGASAGGGGGGGGGGHLGVGQAGFPGGGPNPGAGGGGGPAYDALASLGPDDGVPGSVAGSIGGAGGGGAGSPLDLGSGAHGAASWGNGDTLTNGQDWHLTSMLVRPGEVLQIQGVVRIRVQGDCTIAGQIHGIGAGYPAPAAMTDHSQAGNGARSPSGNGPGAGEGARGNNIAPGGGGSSASGGGAGHGGAGGNGGYGTNGGNWPEGGIGHGGAASASHPDGVTMGASGGTGGIFVASGTGVAQGRPGGAGGAALDLSANRILGTGAIILDGREGSDAVYIGSGSTVWGGGAGGGGAGGHGRLQANVMQCALGLYSRGGRGGHGTQNSMHTNPGSAGGGGGGGLWHIRYMVNAGLPGMDCSPGAGGTSPPTNWGSAGGSGGAGGPGVPENYAASQVGGGGGGNGGGAYKLTGTLLYVAPGATIYAPGSGGAGGAAGYGGGGGGGGGSGGGVWLCFERVWGGGAVYAPGGVGGPGGGGGQGAGGAGGNGHSGRTRADYYHGFAVNWATGLQSAYRRRRIAGAL